MSKILTKITFDKLNRLDFIDLIKEMLDFQLNIIFSNEYDNMNYKKVYDEKDITLIFMNENFEQDDYDIAIYCTIKNDKNIYYLDNITRECYYKNNF